MEIAACCDFPRKRTHYFLSAVNYLTTFLLVCMMVLGWLLFVDGTLVNPVIVHESEVLETDRGFYKPGDIVYAKMEFYKARNIVGELRWNLVDGRIFPYAPRAIAMPVGIVEKWVPVEKLPGCESGEYHFEGIASYRVNPIRVVTVKLRTKPFNILPAGPKER